MAIKLAAGQVVTPREAIERGAVVVSDEGKIVYVGTQNEAPQVDGKVYDLPELVVAPGLIEQHAHGGYGVSFSDPDPTGEQLDAYSLRAARDGITAFLVGVECPDPPTYLARLAEDARTLQRGTPGAEALGFFLEAAYGNPVRAGCIPPGWMRGPDPSQVRDYLQAAQGWLRLMVVAPELPGAQEAAAFLKSQGVVVSLGMTAADYETAHQALETTHTNVDHVFNNFEPFHHRRPGPAGAALSSDREISCELITDGYHVHPAVIKMVLRCLGVERVVIVSDSGRPTGLGDGAYESFGQQVTVRDFQVTLPDGTIASSASPLRRNLQIARQAAGLTLGETLQMASLNPARTLGVNTRLGSLAPGKDASLIAIDEDFQVYLTMVKGKVIYEQL